MNHPHHLMALGFRKSSSNTLSGRCLAAAAPRCHVCHITADIFIIRKCACTFSKRFYTCPYCFACLLQTAVARPFSSSAPALAATSSAPPFRIVLLTPPDDIDMAFVFCSTRTCGIGRVM